MTDDSLPIGPGTAAGVGAWLAGTVLAYGLGQIDPRVGFLGAFAAGTDLVGAVAYVYLLFHGSFLAGSLAAGLYALLPAAVLVVAGFWAADRSRGVAVPGLLRGAAVVVGYLPVTVLVTLYLLFRLDFGFDPVTFGAALLLAGTGFPLVFGGLGGFLADRAVTPPA